MDNLERVLAEHDFLAGLGEGHLDMLVQCASSESYRAGEFLFRQGESASGLFLIQRGRVAIEVASPQRGAITLLTVGRGEMAGWTCVIPPYRHRFDARAVELTRVVLLDGRCLREKLEADKELDCAMLRRIALAMAGRLDSARVQLLDVYGGQ